MQRIIIALVLTFGIVMAIGPTVIRYLRALKAGKKIYELGPKHQSKEGTPMMGGTMMVIGLLVSVLLCTPAEGWHFMLPLLAVALLSMAVGLADDLIQVVKKRHEGLKPMQKIAGQVIVAVGFAVYCYFDPNVGSAIYIPFANKLLDLGILYIPIMSLLAIFMVNSSNLQDGLDGLEATATCVGSVAWGAMAILFMKAAEQAQLAAGYEAIAIYAMALVGATMGYLHFNRYPAKVFMGDMGSMFIGGSVVGMSMLMRQPLMMLLICFTMVMSSGSVMIQTTYFKATHGKRIFKMSPIHHHFELIGMKETQIVSMYAIITGLLSLVAVMSLNGLVL